VKALQIDPDFPSAAYNLGIVHIQAGNYNKGIKVIQDLLQKEPENILILKVLAWAYYKNLELNKAIVTYETILDIDSYNDDALKNITILMINNTMFEEAYPYLVLLESKGDVESFVLYNLGITERELGISSGLEWFELAFNKEQNLEKNLFALIDALKIDQDYDRVIELYDILISINPVPDLYFEKAYVLLTVIEDYNLGIKTLENALQNGYNNLERIEELKLYPDLLDRDEILSVFIDYPPVEDSVDEEEELLNP
jgi:tetratricopeptide (TPR) repeat protein